MPKYPTPTKPGFYWAKLVHPSNELPGEDWASTQWEVVDVFANTLDTSDDDYLRVSVSGVAPSQNLIDFVWGPEVAKPLELS